MKLNSTLTGSMEIVETTSASNGYPEGIRKAVTGFESFAQAEEFARYNHLQLVWIDKRDGWHLWHRGGTALEPMKINMDTITDSQYLLSSVSAVHNEMQDTITALLEDADPDDAWVTADSLTEIAVYYKAMASAAEDMEEWEAILVDGDTRTTTTSNLPGWEVINTRPIEWSEDSKTIKLAAV